MLSSYTIFALKTSIQRLLDTKRGPQQSANLKKFMQIYKDHTIHFCYWEKPILAYSLINSPINHESCFFKVKMCSLMSSNSSYYVLKLPKRNLNAYKPIVEGNSLVPSLKVYTRRKILLLAIWHYTCTRKMW